MEEPRESVDQQRASLFSKLCIGSGHDKEIQELLKEKTIDLDLVWELKNAFDRKCSECCKILIEKCDYSQIKLLDFEPDHDWKNILIDKSMKDFGKNVPLIYQAAYSGLKDILEYILNHDREELFTKYGQFTLLQTTLLSGNIDLFNYFLNLPEYQKLCTYFGSNNKMSDLEVMIMFEEKIASEDIVKAYLKNSTQNIDDEIRRFIFLSCNHKKIRFLAIILKKNSELLQMMFMKAPSLINRLKNTLDMDVKDIAKLCKIDFIKTNKHKQTIINTCLMYEDDYVMFVPYNTLMKDILEVQPKLASMPYNAMGRTLLMYMAGKNRIEWVKLLVETYHVDVNTVSKDDKTALQNATNFFHYDIMDYLLEHGATMDTLTMRHSDPRLNLRDRIMNLCNGIVQGNHKVATLDCLLHVYTIQNVPEMMFEALASTKTDVTGKEAKDIIDTRFTQMCKILDKYHVFNFDCVIEYIIRFCIEEDNNWTSLFLVLKLILPLKRRERGRLHLNRLAESYYNQYGFQLVKDYISIEAFNQVCRGREMASLQRYCRAIIRDNIYSSVHVRDDGHQERIENKYDEMEIPLRLKKYLRLET